MKSILTSPIHFRVLWIISSYLLFTSAMGQEVRSKSGSVTQTRIMKGGQQEVSLTDSRGSLQWQLSDNGADWYDWSGQVEQSVVILVNSPVFLRCVMQDGICDAVYSDVLHFITYQIPEVVTRHVDLITLNTARCGGYIDSDGNDPITEKGVCWSLTEDPVVTGDRTIEGSGMEDYESNLSGLEPDTEYFVRAYATNGAGTDYGEQISFTTSPIVSLPIVFTAVPYNITPISAACGGVVTSDGNAEVTAFGICWSESENPNTAGNKTIDGSGAFGFTTTMSGLSPKTMYYVRAYATNSVGTAYGDNFTFTTLEQPAVPTVTTAAATNLQPTSVTTGGTVISAGTEAVTDRGVCWSTIRNPTVRDGKTSNGSGTGSFVSEITGLRANTRYFAKAFASNSVGTAYGDEITFSTPEDLSRPTLTTRAPTDIEMKSATSGGSITDQGSSPVTARGVCWSTTGNPGTRDPHTTDGTGTGNFKSALSGLRENTQYFVRAYATNSVGTAYGDQVTFTTLSRPVLTTSRIIDIEATTATSGGTITSEGSTRVTARGVCWDTSANPTVSGSHTSDGTGTGTFTSKLTGLEDGTLYYVRAYATNSVGTSYGDEKSFTTEKSVIADADGNIYTSVKIGTQVWMVENLKTTKLNDSTPIPIVTGDAAWGLLKTPGLCWPENKIENKDPYGGLYNWFAVNSGKLALKGWHIPSMEELYTLLDYLGAKEVAGGKLKEAGLTHWLSPNSGATNESGFSARGGGDRINDGNFRFFMMTGYFWLSTERDSSRATMMMVTYGSRMASYSSGDKENGYSVRCIKD